MPKQEKVYRARLIAILIVSIIVILTGALYAGTAFSQGDVAGGVLGTIIALIVLFFAFTVYMRGNRDLKKGFPLKDERSQRVLEKASSKAFYISLYVLLLVGFLSDNAIPFRDPSQALGICVGLMALLFAGLWIYYNRKSF